MRFLLRPGWLALTAAVIAFAAACIYLLAPWQFHRSTERDAANAALRNAQMSDEKALANAVNQTLHVPGVIIGLLLVAMILTPFLIVLIFS